jgi:LysM repeat protein
MLNKQTFSLLGLAILLSSPTIADQYDSDGDKFVDGLLVTNDADKDGKLSTTEVDTMFRLRRFKKVDTNNDGFLDRQELKASFINSAKAKAQREANGESESTIKQFFKENLTPSTQSSSIQTVKDSGQRYTVEPGDSLYSISKRHNVTIEQLKQLNSISDETKIPINQELKIPASQN